MTHGVFFHNGQCWYSISIDTWKTWDGNFGGGGSVNFSVRSIFMKWWPFFNFFIMAIADILFPLTLGKWEMRIFHWFSFPNFLLVQFSQSPILGFLSTLKTFMHGDLSALGKPEMWIFHWFSFPNFLLVQFSQSPILGFLSTLKTFMHGDLSALGKPEMWIFHWFSFPNFHWFSFPSHPSYVPFQPRKTFMHGNLCMVTFLHSAKMEMWVFHSVFWISHWFSFPSHPS